MKIIDIFIEELMHSSGATKEEATSAAYKTCPTNINPETDIPDLAVAHFRSFLRENFTKHKAKMAH